MVHVYPYSVTGHTLASFLLAIAKNDEKGGVVFFFFPEELNASFHGRGAELQWRCLFARIHIVINDISWPRAVFKERASKAEANEGERQTHPRGTTAHVQSRALEKKKKKIIANYFKRLTDQSFIT